MSIPRLLHRVWLGPNPEPDKYRQWRDRLAELNPGWTIVTWDEGSLKALGMDLGELRDAWPSSLAAQSNAVRLRAVMLFGGIYLDCDVEPLKPIPESWLEYEAFGFEQDSQRRICNAIFGAEQRHGWIVNQWINKANYRRTDAAWGVYLMTEMAKELEAFYNIVRPPHHLVYPFSWDTPEAERKVHPDSVLVHHWDKTWIAK